MTRPRVPYADGSLNMVRVVTKTRKTNAMEPTIPVEARLSTSTLGGAVTLTNCGRRTARPRTGGGQARAPGRPRRTELPPCRGDRTVGAGPQHPSPGLPTLRPGSGIPPACRRGDHPPPGEPVHREPRSDQGLRVPRRRPPHRRHARGRIPPH